MIQGNERSLFFFCILYFLLLFGVFFFLLLVVVSTRGMYSLYTFFVVGNHRHYYIILYILNSVRTNLSLESKEKQQNLFRWRVEKDNNNKQHRREKTVRIVSVRFPNYNLHILYKKRERERGGKRNT